MKKILEKELAEIDTKNDIAIFDIDRTIINTVSWYRACITPDLLIARENTEKYKKLDDETFKNPSPEKFKSFYKENLKLIDTKITNEFLNLIKDIPNMKCYFKLNENINETKFYVAGIYTALNLVKIYDDWVKYIKFLIKYYGTNLKIIFLTAGYEPYMRGVVDGVLSKSEINDLNYKVVGTKLSFDKGKITPEFTMLQKDKKIFVKSLIDNGRKIKFLADDSKEDMDLFKTVEEYGGIALNIEHISGKQENETWKKYITKLNKNNLKKLVMEDNTSTASINKEKIELPKLVAEIDKQTNEIGIATLKINDFDEGINLLKKKIQNENQKAKFEKEIKKLVFIKDNIVYLRGNLYYNWLPGYIFIDGRTINEKWKDHILTCKNLLNIILDEKISLKYNTFNEKILIYSCIDNLLEAVLYLLNLIELNNIKGNKIFDKEHSKIKKLAQNTTNLLYMLFFEDEKINYELKRIIDNIENLEIINLMPNYIKYQKTMRELDNNITIFKTVKSIADNVKNIDYIISFPYGGIALGYAFNSYLKIGLKRKEMPKLLNSHYSSKQKIREQRTEKDIEFTIFKYIPTQYRRYVEDIKKGNKTILLLDNNVTTFKTLDLSKNFLKQIGNKVYSAVSAVNYDNIANYLLDKDCEILVSNWRNVLDFHPIEEYITSFNTWKTSQKTKMLEKIYFDKNKIQDIETNKFPKVNKHKYLFKLCRVQNVQDLKTATQNGVNMIGIHAVYPDRIKYLKNEEKYKPINCNFDIKEELPVGILELAGIKDIQNYIPKDMKQAILFEKSLDMENLIECIKLYGLKKNNIYIQLQHRTDDKYIKDIKENITKHVITTVGLFQEDFEEYFWKMHKSLNPKTDYILIDMSKHQPDLISYSKEYKESINKVSVLNHIAPLMKNNKIPIIIADDITPEIMEEYIKIIKKYDINFAGIDMQNTVEYMPNEQRYQIVKCKNKTYQVKIRKSSNKLANWKNFITVH